MTSDYRPDVTRRRVRSFDEVVDWDPFGDGLGLGAEIVIGYSTLAEFVPRSCAVDGSRIWQSYELGRCRFDSHRLSRYSGIRMAGTRCTSWSAVLLFGMPARMPGIAALARSGRTIWEPTLMTQIEDGVIRRCPSEGPRRTLEVARPVTLGILSPNRSSAGLCLES